MVKTNVARISNTRSFHEVIPMGKAPVNSLEEGLVDLLKKYADTPELKHILEHCKEGINGEYAIGAQYLTEIQGGSDVPANLMEAVPENDGCVSMERNFFAP